MKYQFVAYYSVSTNNRGRTGMELAVQREEIESLVSLKNGTLIAEFTETEMVAENSRPALKEALTHCKVNDALLAIGRLDRLSEDKHKISCLMQSGVDFIATESATVEQLTRRLLATVAACERELISTRTRDALVEAKAQGVKLGVSGKVRAAENRRQADAFAGAIAPVIQALQNGGVSSLYSLAIHLNNSNVPTARNRRWHPVTVARLLDRICALGLSRSLSRAQCS